MRFRAAVLLSAVLALAAVFATPARAAAFTEFPSCTIYNAAGKVYDAGTLPLNGTRNYTKGVSGATIIVAKIVIPADAPTGKVIQVAAFSNAWKKVYLSKTPCEFVGGPSNASQGNTASVYMAVGAVDPMMRMFRTVVQQGETWYVNIKHEIPTGGQSCGPGKVCDETLVAYPPS